MKIQCDVCDKDEASVFCVADEAALCSACDHRVHHANKLAGKHQRLSLHHPSPDQSPLCDICRERKAFLFCQQDRAIMCINCDSSIHKANEHTQKHTRFLLTCVKLSSTSALYSSSSTESAASNLKNSTKSNRVPNLKSTTVESSGVPNLKSTTVESSGVPNLKSTTVESSGVPNLKSTTVESSGVPAPESFDKSSNYHLISSNGQISTSSSISEYLIEMLPGWHVEDFLDYPSPIKTGENDGLPFWDADFDAKMSVERMGNWVPQAPTIHPLMHQTTQNQSNQSVDFISFGAKNGITDQSKQFHNNNNNNNNMKSSRKWSDDNSFAVPQISPPSTVFKRSRTLW